MSAQEDRRRPPRITRVYTRIGDKGTTRLAGGREAPKHHPRLCAGGACDELQVAIGAARDSLAGISAAVPPVLRLIGRHLVWLQNRLFTAGAELSTPLEDRPAGMPAIDPSDTLFMEQLIDALNAPLPPLQDFVLPGGHRAVTALHQCRVVCRRLEREVSALAAVEPIPEPIGPFINRLSDLFFVMARRLQHELERLGLVSGEMVWTLDLERPPLPD